MVPAWCCCGTGQQLEWRWGCCDLRPTPTVAWYPRGTGQQLARASLTPDKLPLYGPGLEIFRNLGPGGGPGEGPGGSQGGGPGEGEGPGESECLFGLPQFLGEGKTSPVPHHAPGTWPTAAQPPLPLLPSPPGPIPHDLAPLARYPITWHLPWNMPPLTARPLPSPPPR